MHSGIGGESPTSSTVEIPREKPGTIELIYLNPRNINIPRYYRLVSTDTNCPHDTCVVVLPFARPFVAVIHFTPLLEQGGRSLPQILIDSESLRL